MKGEREEKRDERREKRREMIRDAKNRTEDKKR